MTEKGGGFKAKETQKVRSPGLKEFHGRSDLHSQVHQKPSNTSTETLPSQVQPLTEVSL